MTAEAAEVAQLVQDATLCRRIYPQIYDAMLHEPTLQTDEFEALYSAWWNANDAFEKAYEEYQAATSLFHLYPSALDSAVQQARRKMAEYCSRQDTVTRVLNHVSQTELLNKAQAIFAERHAQDLNAPSWGDVLSNFWSGITPSKILLGLATVNMAAAQPVINHVFPNTNNAENITDATGVSLPKSVSPAKVSNPAAESAKNPQKWEKKQQKGEDIFVTTEPSLKKSITDFRKAYLKFYKGNSAAVITSDVVSTESKDNGILMKQAEAFLSQYSSDIEEGKRKYPGLIPELEEKAPNSAGASVMLAAIHALRGENLDVAVMLYVQAYLKHPLLFEDQNGYLVVEGFLSAVTFRIKIVLNMLGSIKKEEDYVQEKNVLVLNEMRVLSDLAQALHQNLKSNVNPFDTQAMLLAEEMISAVKIWETSVRVAQEKLAKRKQAELKQKQPEKEASVKTATAQKSQQIYLPPKIMGQALTAHIQALPDSIRAEIEKFADAVEKNPYDDDALFALLGVCVNKLMNIANPYAKYVKGEETPPFPPEYVQHKKAMDALFPLVGLLYQQLEFISDNAALKQKIKEFSATLVVYKNLPEVRGDSMSTPRDISKNIEAYLNWRYAFSATEHFMPNILKNGVIDGLQEGIQIKGVNSHTLIDLIRKVPRKVTEAIETQSENVKDVSELHDFAFAVGWVYEKGLYGIVRNDAEAKNYYRIAASNGSPAASLKLALRMYERGTPEAKARAVALFEQAYFTQCKGSQEKYHKLLSAYFSDSTQGINALNRLVGEKKSLPSVKRNPVELLPLAEEAAERRDFDAAHEYIKAYVSNLWSTGNQNHGHVCLSLVKIILKQLQPILKPFEEGWANINFDPEEYFVRKSQIEKLRVMLAQCASYLVSNAVTDFATLRIDVDRVLAVKLPTFTDLRREGFKIPRVPGVMKTHRAPEEYGKADNKDLKALSAYGDGLAAKTLAERAYHEDSSSGKYKAYAKQAEFYGQPIESEKTLLQKLATVTWVKNPITMLIAKISGTDPQKSYWPNIGATLAILSVLIWFTRNLLGGRRQPQLNQNAAPQLPRATPVERVVDPAIEAQKRAKKIHENNLKLLETLRARILKVKQKSDGLSKTPEPERVPHVKIFIEKCEPVLIVCDALLLKTYPLEKAEELVNDLSTLKSYCVTLEEFSSECDKAEKLNARYISAVNALKKVKNNLDDIGSIPSIIEPKKEMLNQQKKTVEDEKSQAERNKDWQTAKSKDKDIKEIERKISVLSRVLDKHKAFVSRCQEITEDAYPIAKVRELETIVTELNKTAEELMAVIQENQADVKHQQVVAERQTAKEQQAHAKWVTDCEKLQEELRIDAEKISREINGLRQEIEQKFAHVSDYQRECLQLSEWSNQIERECEALLLFATHDCQTMTHDALVEHHKQLLAKGDILSPKNQLRYSFQNLYKELSEIEIKPLVQIYKSDSNESDDELDETKREPRRRDSRELIRLASKRDLLSGEFDRVPSAAEVTRAEKKKAQEEQLKAMGWMKNPLALILGELERHANQQEKDYQNFPLIGFYSLFYALHELQFFIAMAHRLNGRVEDLHVPSLFAQDRVGLFAKRFWNVLMHASGELNCDAMLSCVRAVYCESYVRQRKVVYEYKWIHEELEREVVKTQLWVNLTKAEKAPDYFTVQSAVKRLKKTFLDIAEIVDKFVLKDPDKQQHQRRAPHYISACKALIMFLGQIDQDLLCKIPDAEALRKSALFKKTLEFFLARCRKTVRNLERHVTADEKEQDAKLGQRLLDLQQDNNLQTVVFDNTSPEEVEALIKEAREIFRDNPKLFDELTKIASAKKVTPRFGLGAPAPGLAQPPVVAQPLAVPPEEAAKKRSSAVVSKIEFGKK